MLYREKDIQGHLLRTEMNPVLLDGDTGHTKKEKTGVGKQRSALKARREKVWAQFTNHRSCEQVWSRERP